MLGVKPRASFMWAKQSTILYHWAIPPVPTFPFMINKSSVGGYFERLRGYFNKFSISGLGFTDDSCL